MSARSKRFRIALSFPSEHRQFVNQVAERLACHVERKRVLYDKFHEAEFAIADLDTHLQGLYHDESELIAVFLSADYERKPWCGLEWRAMRALITRRQASTIMLLRFDNAEITGLNITDGCVWIDDRSPQEIADLILRRWESSATPPTPGYGALSENSLLVILKDQEIWVADSPGSWHIFPWRLPDLKSHQGQTVIDNARDWKSMHTLAERMYKHVHEMHLCMELCIATGDGSKQACAQTYLKTTDSEYIRRLNTIPPSVSNVDYIGVITRLQFCIPAIQRSLMVLESQELQDGTILVNCICDWLLEVLTRADQVLENYFNQETGR